MEDRLESIAVSDEFIFGGVAAIIFLSSLVYSHEVAFFRLTY